MLGLRSICCTHSLESVMLVKGASGCITGGIFGGEEALEPCLEDIRLDDSKPGLFISFDML